MSADLIGWHDEHSLDHRRRIRNGIVVSFALHGMIVAAFTVTPSHSSAPMPEFFAVELIGPPPAGAASSAPAPPPPAKTVAKPAAPEAPVAPPPPIAKSPVQVLPEEVPGRIKPAKPVPVRPKVVAMVKPEPKASPRRRKREKALNYEDAMAALDDELGVDETAELLTPAPVKAAASDSAGLPDSTNDATKQSALNGIVSPELAAWNLETLRLIQSRWVALSSFSGRGLATGLELRIAESGHLIGEPRVIQSSGDPVFDDNVIRVLKTVAPLPRPPKAGVRVFIFRSETN